MINGLNTGGFDIQDSSSATDITDRALTMLSQYLISNQVLELNSSFKVYLKILSIEHMQSLPPKRNLRKRKFTGRLHVGGKSLDKTFNPRWAFEVPTSSFDRDQQNVLYNNCLLICTILGLLQNTFLKSNGCDKRFVNLSNLRSKFKKQRDLAFAILEHELNELFSVVKIKRNGPFELKTTLKLLHETYKCQFFLFNGISNAASLYYSYPPRYDDTLIPIFMFKPTMEPNHVIFISNLNYYFGSNFTICLACKRSFKSRYNSHICKEKECCFTCRKHIQTPNTYVHKVLEKYFCDKLLYPYSHSHQCSICNLEIYSERCKTNHRKICNGKGKLGYFCSVCQKFISGQNSAHIKCNHNCTDSPICRVCFKPKQLDHLCELKKEKISNVHPRLGFINIEFVYSNTGNLSEQTPCLAVIFREQARCQFVKYMIAENMLGYSNEEPNVVSFDYLPASIKNEPFGTKRLKPSSVLGANILKLQKGNTKDSDCSHKLLCFLLDCTYTCTTYICQDSDALVMMTLLKCLVDHGICPNVIRKGRHILVLDIPELSIRFINSNNYLNGSEYEIAALFMTPCENPIFFPHKFLKKENLPYVGKIPSFEYFENFSDSEDTKVKKRTFIDNFQQVWNLSKELLLHSDQKLNLLLLTMLGFIKECFLLQDSFKRRQPTLKKLYINPIAQPVCTLSGFVFKFYKAFFLNNYPIYTVNNEYGYNERQVSLLEYEYTSYKEYCLHDEKCLTAFNNKMGQKKFRYCIPDLYSTSTKTMYFLNGCYVHAHFDNCSLNKNKTGESPHPFGGTYNEICEKFFAKVKQCMEFNSDIKESIVTWECDFKEVKKTPEFKFFKDNFFVPHPLSRLKPRDTIRGALSDVYALKWSKDLHPNETFYCIDVNGLYSYCAVNFAYMTGKYEIVMGNDLKQISVNDNKLFYKELPAVGSILLTILPPSDLMFPFLLYRKRDGSVTLTLCKTCAENVILECKHNEQERSLTGSYMISEIEYALSLGYQIMYIHEIHCYKKSEKILSDFIKVLNCLKIKASDCFAGLKSDDEKQLICNRMNEKMNLDSYQCISPSNVQPNPAKKNFYKLMCNSLFGKFIQRTDKPQIKYVHCQDELNELFYNGSKIEDYFCLNDEICLVSTSPNVLKLPPNRNQNLYIGSQITAFAREVMHRHAMQLNDIPGCKLYQIECDSLFFSLPNNSSPNLDVSPSLGSFKHVYDGEILGFYSLGQKQYSINYKAGDSVKSIFKISGLSLKNENNHNKINENSFELFLDTFIEGQPISSTFIQQKTKADFVKMKILTYQQKFTLTNKLSTKRFVNVFDARLSTFPFGLKFVSDRIDQ